MNFSHTSVLLKETIESLKVRADGIYVDGTLGGGGHSEEIARRLGENGLLLGVDRGRDAIAAATERLRPYGDKVRIRRGNYRELPQILDEIGIPQVDGILLDLGVSSYQLDTKERGFTYREADAKNLL